MGFSIRDNSRYGRFTAVGRKTGRCIIERDICGFGESITIYMNKEVIFTGEDLEEDYQELENGDIVCMTDLGTEDCFTLGKCLKRFK